MGLNKLNTDGFDKLNTDGFKKLNTDGFNKLNADWFDLLNTYSLIVTNRPKSSNWSLKTKWLINTNQKKKHQKCKT